MDEEGGESEKGARSLRESSSDVSVGQNVRMSKEKMRFDKAAEQTFSTDIFTVAKIIERRPRVLYEIEDFNGTPIDGQFYREDLTPVRITGRKSYRSWSNEVFANMSSAGEVAITISTLGCLRCRVKFTSICSAPPREISKNGISTPISR